MPVLVQNSRYTLAEANKAKGWDTGSMGELAKDHALFDELTWLQNTHGLVNKQTQARALPAGGWSQINGSIASAEGSIGNLDEPAKLFQLESKVDERLLEGITGEEARGVRDSRDELAIEGLISGFTNALIYSSDATNPDAPKGIEARVPVLSQYCVSAGGSGSTLSSALLIQTGKKGFHLGYPGNARPGLITKDRGLHRVSSPDGVGEYYAWCRLMEIWATIVRRDQRALIRLANIDSTHPFTADLAIAQRNKLPSRGRDAIWFVNRDVMTQIDLAAYNKTNAHYTLAEIQGYGQITSVGGVPVRLEDELTATESTVS